MRSNQPWIILSLITLLILPLYHWSFQNKILPHVFIAGQEVSNLTINQAKTVVRQSLPQPLPGLTISFGNLTWSLPLNDLQLEFLVDETINEAYFLGRDHRWFKNLIDQWHLWFNPRHLSLKFSLNETVRNDFVNAIAMQINEPMIPPVLEKQTSGEVKLIPGKNGRQINIELLKQTIDSQLADLNFTPITLPVKLESLNLNAEQFNSALARAENIKFKTLVVQSANQDHKIEGQELMNLIGFETSWNEAEVASLAARLASQYNRPMQNASFYFDGHRVTEFKPAVSGLNLNEPETIKSLINGLEQLLSASAVSQMVALKFDETLPAITTDSVNNLGIKELLGRGESLFKGSIFSRKHNVALTASKINGLVIPPGETFSFNQAVGEISQATGYQTAYVIKDGRTVLGDGGGICQDSTTLFRAALNAGLDIIERRPHSYRVGYYEQNSPVGVDATVYSPTTDFKFINDTPAHILIQTEVDLNKNYLKVEIYGTNDGRQATLSNFRLWGQVPPPPDLYIDDPTLPSGQIKQIDWRAAGAKAAFDWHVTRNGETLRQKTFYSHYQPWQAIFLRGTN